MGGFRLDQRRYAMPNRVGANGARIAPGESGRSRLYQKVAGSQAGLQMPPTGALSQEQIGTIKAWIDQGADWPDELSGEAPQIPPDPGVIRIMEALRNGDRQGFDKLLRETPKVINSRGKGGSTPLMYAALYGQAETVRRLLDKGADPNLKNDAGATALMWAVDDVEKTRQLLDHGADPNVLSADGRTALTIAAQRFGASPLVKLLLDHGAEISPPRGSPVNAAALAGDEDVLRMFLARGADAKSLAGGIAGAVQSQCSGCIELLLKAADQRSLDAAMAASTALGDLPTLKLLLERGAQVNATDPTGDGVSALMLAVGSDAAAVETIRLMMERGADIHYKNGKGETLLDVAKWQGPTPIVDLLRKAGATEMNAPAAGTPRPAPATSIRAAVERSIPAVQRADVAFIQRSGCVSCHNNSLAMMMVVAARKNRLPVDEEIARRQAGTVGAYIETWRERMLQGIGIPGGQDTVGYILAGLAAVDYPGDAATDSAAIFLRTRQYADGRWRTAVPGGSRPPIESSDFETTAIAARVFQVYAPKTRRLEYQKAVQRAADWLAKAEPKTNEDHVFQLLGLTWAGRNKGTLRQTAGALLAQQRTDGGWAQLPTLPSDAYATGQALGALKESGALAVTDAAYKAGVGFLVNSQLADGSWYVRSRALPFQPYFESDFPHGHNQFISAAATNWAVMALAPATR
jgi:ankyrin repeat protein